jgi:hypothetical protein
MSPFHPDIDIPVEVVGQAVSASASQGNRHQGNQKDIELRFAVRCDNCGTNPDKGEQNRLAGFEHGYIIDKAPSPGFSVQLTCKRFLRCFGNIVHLETLSSSFLTHYIIITQSYNITNSAIMGV